MECKYKKYYPYLLLLLGAVAYSTSFRGVFLLDDCHIPEEVGTFWSFVAGEGVSLRRIIVKASFALSAAMGGRAADYHLGNLLVHLMSGLLLYRLVLLTQRLGGIRLPKMVSASSAAFVTAALWLVHPLTTNAVTYISQRHESLAALLMLAAVTAAAEAFVRKSVVAWFVVSPIAAFLGMMTKETALVVPVAVALYDYVFCRGSGAGVKNRYVMYGGYVLCLVLMVFVLGSEVNEGELFEEVYGSWMSVPYFLTQCEVILHYIRLSFIPVRLCFDYEWSIVSSASKVLPELAVLTAVGLLSLHAVVKRKPAGFAGLVFFILLAPSSSFTARPDPAFEYRMYLPLAALIALAVFTLLRLFLWLETRGWMDVKRTALILCAVSVLVVSSAAWLTVSRNRLFRSEEAVWLQVVERKKDHIRGNQSLANYYYAVGDYERSIHYAGRILERLAYLDTITREELLAKEGSEEGARLFRVAYHYSGALNTIGMALYARGEKERAVKMFMKALRLAPGNEKARGNLNIALETTSDTNVE